MWHPLHSDSLTWVDDASSRLWQAWLSTIIQRVTNSPLSKAMLYHTLTWNMHDFVEISKPQICNIWSFVNLFLQRADCFYHWQWRKVGKEEEIEWKWEGGTVWCSMRCPPFQFEKEYKIANFTGCIFGNYCKTSTFEIPALCVHKQMEQCTPTLKPSNLIQILH